MTLQPPAVPLFVAGTTGAAMPAAMNSLVRDPLTFLLDPPTLRLRRAGALNVTENVHQYIPFDTADEDSELGWTSPAVVGGGGSSTLNGATIVGATSATLVSAANFAIGDYARIDTGANVEYRQLTNVAGAVISWSASVPLALAHSSGAAVAEVTSDPSRYVVAAPGWYQVEAKVSLFETGAAQLALIPGVAVNGASHTGVGSPGWEGMEHAVPTGVAAQPKASAFMAEIYCNVGDLIQLDLWFSTEGAATSPVDVTAGWECAMRLVWTGL